MTKYPGFSEEAGMEFVADPNAFVEPTGNSFTVKMKVGPAGRIIIPAEVRVALEILEGDTLVAVVENKKVTLTTVKAALAEAQALVRKFVPAHVRLSDELIADRRRENEEFERNG